MFDVDYFTVKDKKGLEELLNNFFKTSEKPRLLEVFTDANLNDGLLRNYFKYL